MNIYLVPSEQLPNVSPPRPLPPRVPAADVTVMHAG